MWSMRCLLSGHDDMLVRRPHRLSLRCRYCGRETRGWNLNRSHQEAAADQRADVDASKPMVEVVGVTMARLLNWRRKMATLLWRAAPKEG